MYDFPFELDDFQKEACQYISDGKSVVVCAPTGAGKTVIAQHAIHCALESGKKVFYTTPLKALSNQKYNDFSEQYGQDKVGLLTGDTSINRGAQITVMTTEVFRNMLYGTNFGSLADNLRDVGYAVLDEVHYMNDEQRGTVWEESIIYCPVNVQIIALSATVANADKLTEWINTVHSQTKLVNTDFRPVPLRFFYFDSSQPDSLLPLLAPNGTLNKKIKPEKRIFQRGKAVQKRGFVRNIVKNLHERNMLPAIYFTFSRKKCDEQMEKCAGLELITPEERREIERITDEYIAENPYLYKNKHLEYLCAGVASHHAGLLPGWKVLVEKLFQKGLIKVVFATETLAAGINMPARSTVIGSISKRTDTGHRMLTPSEFLQMSGRAGRRGMDEIGYVVIAGSPFQTPEEAAELVLSGANPLESKFSPSYSMVLNLLQRFSLEEAKELVLKSFGYYSSNYRTEPLIKLKEEVEEKISECNSFSCFCGKTNADLLEYNKTREIYIRDRKTFKTIVKQEKKKNRPLSSETENFGRQTKLLLNKMHSYECDTCKSFKKHMKNIDLLKRYDARRNALLKEIDKQKDIFWNRFLAHRAVLADYGYLRDDYPASQGVIISQLHSENELFLARIIFSGALDGLSPAELAGVICAVTTEDIRSDIYVKLPFSVNVRKRLNKIKDIRRDLDKKQKFHDVDDPMYINGLFSPLIEMWVNGSEWEDITSLIDIGEGDIVRSFKRTADVLRQFCTIQNIQEDIVFTAREAIDLIQRSPIDVD